MSTPMLLTDQQMQRFIAHGYLPLQTSLPESFHRAIYDRFDALIGGDADLNPGNNLLPACPEIGALFQDPVVTGALSSVLGADYAMHPHRALHNNVPGSPAQITHKDSYWGYRRRVRNHRARWAMIMYVPQATPLEQGPTGIIPGSQYQMRKPDESVMPEVPGCLPAGGFLLIHYDIWHRKMQNFTQNKRFMLKFEFMRMHEPKHPSWDHRSDAWGLDDLPALDMSALWRRQWDWLRGARRPMNSARVGIDVAAGLACRNDPHTILRTLNAIADDLELVCAALDALTGLLAHDVDPVSIDAAYVTAAAGKTAVAPLHDIILQYDGEHVPEKREGQEAIDYVPNEERIARNATMALVEIGEPSVSPLLDLLSRGAARARKLAAFALGELGSTGVRAPGMIEALCRATLDEEPAVRVNAVEALGLLQVSPEALTTLTASIRDGDEEVRFSAALSLAKLGPDAAPAVAALAEALYDSNRYVPGYAIEALERIGTPGAMGALLPFLKNARWCSQSSAASPY